jgi:hypothetical protein
MGQSVGHRDPQGVHVETDDLNDRLDRAVAATDLGAEKIPVWAGLVRVLQWMLIITAVVGGLWLALLAFGPMPGCPSRPRPTCGGSRSPR